MLKFGEEAGEGSSDINVKTEVVFSCQSQKEWKFSLVVRNKIAERRYSNQFQTSRRGREPQQPLFFQRLQKVIERLRKLLIFNKILSGSSRLMV